MFFSDVISGYRHLLDFSLKILYIMYLTGSISCLWAGLFCGDFVAGNVSEKYRSIQTLSYSSVLIKRIESLYNCDYKTRKN